MKYVLLFVETKDRAKQWEAMPEAQRMAAYAPINQWFEKYSSKITGGHELQPERTATTVKFSNGKPVVTDGPFIEGKETIGGYAEVTVADLDQLRRQARFRDKLAQLEGDLMRDDTAEGDDRLRLIFTCCHPALSREAQVALTLRAVAGLTTIEIARAFITSEATIAQRIVRAKRKIVDANIPYRVPAEGDMAERLEEVLAVLYLMFNEGYLATAGEQATRRDLAEDAAWLAGLMVRLMPDEPEALGLLALMRLHLARARARFDDAGNLVLLRDQDRGRWDKERIGSAMVLLQRAAMLHRSGPYQLQAAIAACHAEAGTWGETDWRQIVALYDALPELMPTPVGELNRALGR